MTHFTQSLKKELAFYGFESVNLITGFVLCEGMDFAFSGMLPLKWKRVYHSDSSFKGVLGRGVHCLADMKLDIYHKTQCIGLLLDDGICDCDYAYSPAYEDLKLINISYIVTAYLTQVRAMNANQRQQIEERMSNLYGEFWKESPKELLKRIMSENKTPQ